MATAVIMPKVDMVMETGTFIAWLKQEGRDDQAGLGLGPAGDQTGDGHDDFLVGAPWESSAGMQAGAVYVVGGL